MEKWESALALELYRSHYNAKEASHLLDTHYQNVANVFRGFRVARIPKYNRVALIRQFCEEPHIVNRISEIMEGISNEQAA
jgi:hypothetical protein